MASAGVLSIGNLCANVVSAAGGDEMPVFEDIVQLPDYGDHGIK
jgi:hypothetical protein